MDASHNDTFQQLLEEIKRMNKNLETASIAINNMTVQLTGLYSEGTRPLDFIPLLQTEKAASNSDVPVLTDVDVSAGGDNSPRSLGYVNWKNSHDILKSQRLIKTVSIRSSLKKLQSMPEIEHTSTNTQSHYNQRAITQTNSSHQAYNGLFTFNESDVMKVDKEIRFPQDAVYIDVNSPKIKPEVEFMNKLNVKPTVGVINRFLNILESEKHTCSSFEKQHGLKWV